MAHAPARLNPGAFSAILEARRGRFNGQFAEARRVWPALDPAVFAQHLVSVVSPLVESAAELAPERAEAVAEGLYGLSLQLLGRDYLGPNSRYTALAEAWSSLLPALPNRLAEDPRLFAGAVTNAIYNLSATPGARPRDWMTDVQRLSDVCGPLSELLEAAKVAAWRAGLAHYRYSALSVCAGLRPAVAAAALGLPGDAIPFSAEALAQIVSGLQADPWLAPAEAAGLAQPRPRHLELIARVGAFRGFGGQFMAPPKVSCPGGQFVVSDGAEHWLLFADCFGASLHRSPSPPHAPLKLSAPLFRLKLNGKVSRGNHEATFPDLDVTLSTAANASTLAVTTPLSHAVSLIALVGAGAS